jgi:HSP20 family molecular chaperone IbpA
MVAPNVWLRTSSPVDTLNGARRQLERLFADVSTGIDETWTMPAEIVETANNYRLAERRYGRYARSFRLPGTVDTNRVQASCEHGVLTMFGPAPSCAGPVRRLQQ